MSNVRPLWEDSKQKCAELLQLATNARLKGILTSMQMIPSTLEQAHARLICVQRPTSKVVTLTTECFS